jgi:hypothetical protein
MPKLAEACSGIPAMRTLAIACARQRRLGSLTVIVNVPPTLP